MLRGLEVHRHKELGFLVLQLDIGQNILPLVELDDFLLASFNLSDDLRAEDSHSAEELEVDAHGIYTEFFSRQFGHPLKTVKEL